MNNRRRYDIDKNGLVQSDKTGEFLGAYTLEREDDFLYSNHSEYIHVIITGITPSRNDT